MSLEDAAKNVEMHIATAFKNGATSRDAEVAALKAEVERYRKALEYIAKDGGGYGGQDPAEYYHKRNAERMHIAAVALSPMKQG